MLWNRKFETGNEMVDSQHKELYVLVQKVLDIDFFADRKEKISTALGFLADYTVRHFQSEESLMDECNYPASAEHKKQHSDFVEEVSAFIKRFEVEGDKINLSQAVNWLVVDWLQEHIMGSDKELADYYKNFKT